MSDPKGTNEEFPYQIDEFYLDLQNDGSSIAILDQAEIVKMPFPGLRPFKTSEFQLFKGRGDQAEELIKRLQRNKVLAVIGSSGTGKSSLVRAGLIPQLLGGYLHEAGNKWNIAICRPGKNPIENLTIALSSVKSKSKDKNDIISDFKLIEPILTNSVYGILDVNELLNSGKSSEEKHNLLIIVDQFEELFRFQRKDLDKGNIESHFVNLLLKAALNPSGSVYVIITMRSEFLGDCVKFRGLPEAINEGQYLVPQLSRNQLKEAIQGPIRLAGKKIEAGLVELLINEIDENKLKENLDQLPILQHALMRSYNQAMLEGDETEICLKHYEHIGTMKKALANHAEAKYDALGNKDDPSGKPSKKQEIAKIVFQALTDTSTDQKGGRRPIELAAIYAVAASLNATHKEVDEVINHFRETETSFIMPPINTTLHPGLILDISHESLMRNWERLNDWMDEEAKNGRLYKMLSERRILNEQGGGNDQLLRGILLAEMLNWEKFSHNSAWAARYHTKADLINDETDEDIFTKNLNFLHTSNEEAIRIKNLEKKNLLNKIKLTTTALIISAALLIWAVINSAKANHSKIEAIITSEIANEEKNKADLLTFEIKLNLRGWWNDTSYLTSSARKAIRDSLVVWSVTRHKPNDFTLAAKLDYSLRLLHEAVGLSAKDPTYPKLISYVHYYDRNSIIDSAISRLNSHTQNSQYNSHLWDGKGLIDIQKKIGTDYFNENNYAGAILVFKDILKKHYGNAPTDKVDSARAYDMIGKAYLSSNNYREAVYFYKKADSLDYHQNLNYLCDLGEAYIAIPNIPRAESVLHAALELDRQNPKTLALLGQLLYLKAQSLKSRGKSYTNEKYTEAISRFKNVISVGSTDSVKYSKFIKTYKDFNSPDTEKYLKLLKNTNIMSSVTYGWIIKTYKKLESPKIKKYIKSLKNASIASYDDWFILASYFDGKEEKNAITWYKNYISKVGKTYWLPYNNIALDFCRLDTPKCDSAIMYADSAIALTGTESALTQSQINLSKADFLQSGTQFVPDPPNPYAHKAYACLIKSQKQSNDSIKYKYQALAFVNLENALNRDPNYPKTHFYYACYYAINGKTKEAIDELDIAINRGFNDKTWIRKETMLNSIRNEPEYRKLMDKLDKDPFAD